VGLIQRVIEAAGIPTISVTLSRGISRKVKPPRAIFTGFPLGHPFGFPYQRFRQLQLLRLMLHYLNCIDTPGAIIVEKLVQDGDPEHRCVLCENLVSTREE
jgi:D-proline reductase (dithiol) PrdB